MNTLRKKIEEFIQDEEGLTLLEYILGAALIVGAVIGSNFWTTIQTKFTEVGTAVDTAGDP